MNDRVKEILDALFAGVEENEETKALYDELLQNCSEHYEDLLAGGMSEQAAADAVSESLDGMQELLSAYRRDDREAEPEPEGEGAEEPEAEDAVYSRSWPAEGIGRLRVDAGMHDVRLHRCDGDEIMISSDMLDDIRVERTGDTLNVTVVRVSDALNAGQDAGEEMPKNLMDMTLGNILERTKKIVSGAVQTLLDKIADGNLMSRNPLSIGIPDGVRVSLDVNTSVGDLCLEGVGGAEVTLRTASGDIRAEFAGQEASEKVFASSASGDISLTGISAESATVSSISGDVKAYGGFGTLLLKSVSGDVQAEGAAREITSKSVSGDVRIVLNEAPEGTVDASTTSGDVSILLPGDIPGVHAEYTGNAGDFRTDFQDAGAEAPLRITIRSVSGDAYVGRM